MFLDYIGVQFALAIYRKLTILYQVELKTPVISITKITGVN